MIVKLWKGENKILTFKNVYKILYKLKIYGVRYKGGGQSPDAIHSDKGAVS